MPRLINTLCDTAMMAAFTADRDTVTRADIISAVQELQWLRLRPPSAPPRRAKPSACRRRAARGSADGRPALGRLLVATDGRTVQEIPLRPGRVIVGRTPDNDLHIDSRFISRHHCQIITTQHSCVIEDLNSTNGIYVKSNRVRRHYLNDGDVVLVGKHELIYVDERAARRARHALRTRCPGLQTLREAAAAAADGRMTKKDDAERAPLK